MVTYEVSSLPRVSVSPGSALVNHLGILCSQLLEPAPWARHPTHL